MSQAPSPRRVSTAAQLMDLLDSLYGADADRTSARACDFWGRLLQQPGHVLNTSLPDANLVAWHTAGLLPTGSRSGDPHGRGPGRPAALDVGCGLGRNAAWLAAVGFSVTAIDIAEPALVEARHRGGAKRRGAEPDAGERAIPVA